KLIGVAAENGSITLSLRKLLALNGLGRDDFRTRFVDGTPARLDCLEGGDCDAVPLGPPQGFVPMPRRYRLLRFFPGAVAGYLYAVTAARRWWAAANKEALVLYLRALAAAFKYIRDPDNRANVVKTIVETTGFAEGNAQLTLALYFEPDRLVLPKAGE